jgi:hypothetical protein
MQQDADSAKAIKAFAFRVEKRLRSAGDHVTTRDDIEQELWIAWCLARDAYNAESGVPFMAYLRNGMRLHINRWVEKHVDRRHDEVCGLRLDKTSDAANGETDELYDVIASDEELPDVQIERKCQMAFILGKLSPRAQAFVTLLETQPPELLAEVRRVEQRVEFARQRGIATHFCYRLTAAMVFDLMGADRAERRKINSELSRLAEKVQRVA